MVTTFGTETDPARRIRKRQGAEIKRIRKMRGMSVQEFADAVEKTVGAVCQWELGNYSPRPAVQVRIATVLDVPWSTIFGLDREVA